MTDKLDVTGGMWERIEDIKVQLDCRCSIDELSQKFVYLESKVPSAGVYDAIDRAVAIAREAARLEGYDAAIQTLRKYMAETTDSDPLLGMAHAVMELRKNRYSFIEKP